MNIKALILFLGLALILGACRSSASLFSMGKVQYSPNSKEVCELPIRIDRNLFFVDVEIEGETYNFLFDSGAPMVISQDLADKYQCKVLKNSKIRDSQNQVRKQNYVLLPDLKIGDRMFTGLAGLASDLKASAILNCLDLDGIIGANAMAMQYWDFSVADSIMRVSKSKSHWPKTKKYVFHFGMKSTRTPLIQLKVNNTDVAGITFDTGSSGVLSFNKSMSSSFKAEDAHFSSYGYLSGGLFGSALDTAHEFMMTFNFPDTNLRVPIEQEMNKKGKLLGMGFLRDYHVFLDYPEKEILLMPKTAGPRRPSFAFAPIYENDQVIIGMLNTLLPDSLNQLQLGDTIIAVNGMPLPNNPSVEDYCFTVDEMRGNKVQVKIKNKGEYIFCRQAIPMPD